MLTLTEITILLFAHFVGDFIMQTDAMAKGKSSSNGVLFSHVLAYTGTLAVVGFFIPISLLFLLINFAAHFATDFVSSRITKSLWAQNKVHWFFVVIGADQLIHALTLVWSYWFCMFFI